MSSPNASSGETSSGAARVEGDAPLAVEDPRFRTMRRLVNALLAVMIAAVVTVTFALVLKLRDLPSIGVAPLKNGERILSAAAETDRVTLTLETPSTGGTRVIVLDGRSFKPIAEITGETAGDEKP